MLAKRMAPPSHCFRVVPHGNVRELRSLLERALQLSEPGETTGEEHLFDRNPGAPALRHDGNAATLSDKVMLFERDQIARAR